jgi:hypothetical protein
MNYSEEEVYTLVGKQDKTATVIFKTNSDSFELYGPHVTVLFLYTQYEREELDQRITNPDSITPGIIKVRHLTSQLDKEKIKQLESDGINTNDISSILYFKNDTQNTFHSKEKRVIKKLEIPIRIQPKGRDFDWMYGFAKRSVESGTGLSPKERQFYLAGKLYYEHEVLTNEERNEIFDDAHGMDEGVELEHLKIKYQREEVDDTDKKRIVQLIRKKDKDDMELLDKYLKETGSSLSKLAKEDLDSATKLLFRISKYREKHFNVVGKKAIYLDVDRYLHVYMRHVEEMKINKHFVHKSNIQWNEEDVVIVIDKVIEKINDEIQVFFERNPGKRYSRYGKESVYFEGDYYTLHIEANGSISTFHRTWKEQEQEKKGNDTSK